MNETGSESIEIKINNATVYLLSAKYNKSLLKMGNLIKSDKEINTEFKTLRSEMIKSFYKR